MSAPIYATAAEVSRNFGRWQDTAQAHPVLVTHHGRSRVVILSMEQYTALQRTAPSPNASQRPGADVGGSVALLKHLRDGFVAFDRHLRIRAVNLAFEDMANRAEDQLIGETWENRFPEAGILIQEHLRRTLRTGEEAEFDVEAAIRPDQYYNVRTFSYPTGAAMLIRNRTFDRDTAVRLEEAVALRSAVRGLGDVAIVKLNLRGVYTEVDPVFTRLTGFTGRDLGGVRFSDTVRPQDRGAVHEIIERALQHGQADAISVTLLAKGLDEAPVQLSVAPIVRSTVAQGLLALLAGRASLKASAESIEAPNTLTAQAN